MNQLRGFCLGLVAVVSGVALVLVAGVAADFISARIVGHLGVGGVVACVVVAMALPALLSYTSARSGQLIAVALAFIPAVVCVFAAMMLTVRGPLGDLLRAGLGRGGLIVVAVTTFGLAGLGGLLGLLLGNPRANRAVQIAGALLLSLSLGAWTTRLLVIYLGWFLGWPVLVKWIASVPWSIDAARVINSPAAWRGLQVVWNAGLVAAAFVAVAELETWAFASAAAQIPDRLGRALRSLDERVRPQLCKALFIDGPLGAATLCEVRWRPFRPSILLVSRATLDALDDGALVGALAHEGAHVTWGHLRARLLWAYGLWLATTAAFGFFTPRSLFGYEIISVSAGLTYLFLLLSVVRLQEQQADRYAAEVVGAEPLLRALTQLSQSPLELFRGPDLSIWTTHGSWTTRRERLATSSASSRPSS